jgi:hypothetical protein
MGKYFAEKHIGGPQLFIELERRRAAGSVGIGQAADFAD